MTQHTHLGLLRGINVGGKNKLPMAALRALFETAGATAVTSYIQSGNILFRASRADANAIAASVSASIAKDFGYNVPLVIRSAAQLQSVIEANPYPIAGDEPKTVHVAFLSRRPTKAQRARLDPQRSPGDEFTLDGTEVYLHCPNGMARTKLTNQYFDKQLEVVSTMRNWRSVLKLAELAEATTQAAS